MPGVAAEVAHHRVDPGKIGVAGVGRGRIDTDEEQTGAIEHLAHLRGEVQTLLVAGDHLGETRFVDRYLTPAQRLDLLRDDVTRKHLVAEVRETGGRDQAYPADADHADSRLF